MKRFKQYLRKCLISWLGIDTLINEVEENYMLLTEDIKHIRTPDQLLKKVEQVQDNINNLHSYFGTAVDVHYPNGASGSWAIITVGGKKEFMEFIDLNGMDFRELQYFLRRFRKENRVADVPPTMRRMFNQF